MVRFFTIIAIAGGLGACALAPDQAEPSWTDALLAEAPPGSAPVSVMGQPLDNDVRRELLTSAVVLQYQGRAVRDLGVVLRAPDAGTALFVVDARQRAQPPAPR
jgi:hypothetical protein